MSEQPQDAAAGGRWLEVYDGTVDPRVLARWLALLVALGVAAFLGAALLFARLADPEIVRGYALLAGLIVIVVGAAVSARRIPPKRTISMDRLDEAGVETAAGELAELAGGTLGSASAGPAVADEMRRVGLGRLLADDHGAGAPGTADARHETGGRR